MRYFDDAKTFFDPPKFSSFGFLRSEVSTKNTIALFPSFFVVSDGPKIEIREIELKNPTKML